MYVPEHFAEARVEVLHQALGRAGLATLVTAGSSGLDANHVPLLLEPEPGPLGRLVGHVARANPLWRTTPDPWKVADAPADFLDGMLKGIVGFELTIARLEGKWKASQNRSEADRRGVEEGLRSEGQAAMAELVRGQGR